MSILLRLGIVLFVPYVVTTAWASPGGTSVVFGGYNAQTNRWFGTTVSISGDLDSSRVFDGDLTPLQANTLLGLTSFETRSDESPGVLKSRSLLSGTADLSPHVSAAGGWLQLSSFASYSDQITFGGGTGAGYFRLLLEQTSALTFTDDGLASTRTRVFAQGKSVVDFIQAESGTIDLVSDTIDFQFGVETGLLSVSTQSIAELRDTGSQTVSGFAESDAGHTLRVKGLLVFDAQGNPLSNVPVSSQSGFVYQPVPEPATLAALSLGATALLRRRRRA